MSDMLQRNRKFSLAVFAICVASLALFTDKMDGGTWVAAASLILGLYGTANVVQGKNKND